MKQSCGVPAFLTKLWALVEDNSTDDLICWSRNGTCFQVLNERKFAKEILPLYFKHNNLASFVRQLNMYGFHKVVHIDVGLPRDRDEMIEFQHPYLIRGQPDLLEKIKRKVSVSRSDDSKLRQQEVSKILSDVHQVKDKQDLVDSKFLTIKRDNEALWKELSSLRQKNQQQHKIIHKIVQFIATMVQSKTVPGIKRKMPLMIGNPTSPKYSRPITMDPSQEASVVHGVPHASMFDSKMNSSIYPSGIVISDVTDLMDKQTKNQNTNSGSCEELLDLPDLLLENVENPFTDSVVSLTSEDLYDTLLDENYKPESSDGIMNRKEVVDQLELINRSLSQIHSSVSNTQLSLDAFKYGAPEQKMPPNVEEEHGYSVPLTSKEGKVEPYCSSDFSTGVLFPKDEVKDEDDGMVDYDMLPSLLEIAQEASDMTFYPSDMPDFDTDALAFSTPKSKMGCS